MTTTAAKLWFAVAALAFAAFWAYGFASGWDWFGTFVLGTIVAASGLLGVLAVVVRDGDVAVEADDPGPRTALPAAWPAVGAVGAGVAVVGLAGRNALLWVGIGLIGIVLIEWMVQGWAERATADPAYNRSLRDRIMAPFEIPAVAVIVIGGFLLCLSRVLLAVSVDGARVIALAVASAILLIAFLVAYRPKVGSSVLAGILAVGAVALIAAGIAGGVAGEREGEAGGHEPAHETTTSTTTPGSS